MQQSSKRATFAPDAFGGTKVPKPPVIITPHKGPISALGQFPLGLPVNESKAQQARKPTGPIMPGKPGSAPQQPSVNKIPVKGPVVAQTRCCCSRCACESCCA